MQFISATSKSLSRYLGLDASNSTENHRDLKIARVALIAIYSAGSLLCTVLAVQLAQPLWLAPALFFAFCAVWAYSWDPDTGTCSLPSLSGGNSGYSCSNWDRGPFWHSSRCYPPRGGGVKRATRWSKKWAPSGGGDRPLSLSGTNLLPGIRKVVGSAERLASKSVASTSEGRQIPGMDPRR